MMHPSRCCKKGVHARTEVHPGTFRCIWCGDVILKLPPKETVNDERT